MKIKSIFFLFFLCLNNLYSLNWIAEVRGSYFYPTSEKFREIYKQGGLEGEIELTKICRKKWMGWGNINYFQKNGNSIGFSDPTTIRMIPISFGAKYQFLFCNLISPYLGAGLSYTFVNIKNDSDFVHEHVTKGGFGGVVKSGTYINLKRNLVLDLFIDYYYLKMHFYSNDSVNMGGLKMGLGLGCLF